MPDVYRFKRNRVCSKAQSLSEMAVFGSILLLVLGFLLRYGLQYNYQQQVKMEAFRRSMKMAADSDASQSQQVMVVKDAQIPNPQDIFGHGERTTIRGSSDIFWSNNTSGVDYSDATTLPSMTYVFNPDRTFSRGSVYNEIAGSSSVEKGVTKEYTLARKIYANGAIVTTGGNKLKGVTDPVMVSDMARAKVYQEDDGFTPKSTAKEVMILMAEGKDCDNEYCPKAILEETELLQSSGQRKYFPVLSVTGNENDAPQGIDFLDSEGGQLNSARMARQTENKVINKTDSLTMQTDPGVIKSTDSLAEKEEITHVVVGADDPTFVFNNTTTKIWTTSD
jgi:hypothetical protein